jgi:hypothetical protein
MRRGFTLASGIKRNLQAIPNEWEEFIIFVEKDLNGNQVLLSQENDTEIL